MKSLPDKHMFFATYNSQWFYSYDTEINRKKRKYESSGNSITSIEAISEDDILYIGVDTGDLNIFSINDGSMIGNWNFSSGKITQLSYMKYEEKLLIMDEMGRIIIFNHSNESSYELRRYIKKGNFKGILTERDEFLHIIGYED